MKNILWLASWYPDQLDPLSGDFIERHARSASLLNRITVLYVVKDDRDVTAGKQYNERRKHNENLSSVIAYYKPSSKITILEKFFSAFRYFMIFKQLIDDHIRMNGKPDLVNVQISYKSGLAALYCKRRYSINYVVSEQWTIFCKEAKPGFNDQNFIARNFITLIYKNALHCSTVSKYLGHAISERFHIKMPVRIPNVVDTKLFFPSANDSGIFRFIHISLMHYQKNTGQILEAARLLKRMTAIPFELVLYGPVRNDLVQLTGEYDLNDTVNFKGEVFQDVLSKELGRSDALILYSRFETFGCVIVEAYASGVPVIVSDIPVMHEIVEENKTGLFVPLDHPQILADKMLWMMTNRDHFDKVALAKHAEEKYGFNKVALQYDEFYRL
jgi:glycosyltransferase involved in cell wall biosynthesis